MKKILTTTLTILSLLGLGLLSGCNTIQGIGKDIKKTGEVIEGAGKK